MKILSLLTKLYIVVHISTEIFLRKKYTKRGKRGGSPENQKFIKKVSRETCGNFLKITNFM